MEIKKFSDFKIELPAKSFVGDKIDMERVLGKQIIVHDFKIVASKPQFQDKGNGRCLYLQITYKDEKRIIFSGSGYLMDAIEKVAPDGFPFFTTIIKSENKRLDFT